MSWNDGLEKNSSVYKFANDTSQNIRVVAGPGTGKSFGIQKRIARLLEEGVDPKRILAVTFTRTAAQDLKTSISTIGIKGANKIISKTLHSFCFQILNKQDIIRSTGRYPRPMLTHELKPMLYDIGDEFGSIREKEKRLLAFEAIWARLQSETPGYIVSKVDQRFEKTIMNWLTYHHSMLFGEMIRETYKYLKNNPQCTERKMFDHILVDEYQDLNKAEQKVIDYLACNANIVIVGDDDQSIYSFKHAHPDGIREFPKSHKGCSNIDFDVCRRCPKKVVKMASKLISNNEDRTLGDLNPFDKNAEGNVKIVQFKDLESEIEGLSNTIKKQLTQGKIEPKDVLILVPVRKIGYRIRNVLIDKNVPAKSYFPETALRTEEGKHLYSILNLLANSDDLVAWRFLLGQGSTDYKTNSYSRILDYAHSKKLGIIEIFDDLKNKKIQIQHTSSIVKRYVEICEELKSIRNSLNKNRNYLADIIGEDDDENSDLRNVIMSAIDEVGFMEEDDVESWIKEIFTVIVERISYPQIVNEQDHVRIMSLHASKGLSSKFVVIMSCIDELIPRIHPDSSTDEIIEQIEEQRRLFYVAITRCKCCDEYPGTLIISSFVGLPGNEALQISIPSKPYWRKTRASRFISEFQDTAPDTKSIE